MKKCKILIADDDREHLIMMALMLRKEGYDVISAFNVQSAIQLAVEQDPDILLLDVHMGDEDGYAVQERLQSITEIAEKPVIYITGDKSCWIQFITTALGARAVLRKPFEREELLKTIKNLLEAAPTTPISADPALT
jgi:two-component system response regulator VicR